MISLVPEMLESKTAGMVCVRLKKKKKTKNKTKNKQTKKNRKRV